VALGRQSNVRKLLSICGTCLNDFHQIEVACELWSQTGVPHAGIRSWNTDQASVMSNESRFGSTCYFDVLACLLAAYSRSARCVFLLARPSDGKRGRKLHSLVETDRRIEMVLDK
jgi:hypothetical protein